MKQVEIVWVVHVAYESYNFCQGTQFLRYWMILGRGRERVSRLECL